MARKTSLRDFQAYLATRLTNAALGMGAASWLGVEAGGESWLVDLSDGGEIVQSTQLAAVPLTHPWFVGIANIRGNLHAVTDLSLFRGGPPIAQNANARLLLIGARYGVNAALLVSRMLGLKNPEDFTPQSTDQSMPTWGKARFSDTHGNIWHKLSVRDLLADQAFMNIGV
jgi:twitching motility protein PilI